jgi:hypothetical protein
LQCDPIGIAVQGIHARDSARSNIDADGGVVVAIDVCNEYPSLHSKERRVASIRKEFEVRPRRNLFRPIYQHGYVGWIDKLESRVVWIKALLHQFKVFINDKATEPFAGHQGLDACCGAATSLKEINHLDSMISMLML